MTPYKYHHLGIPTKIAREGEIYLKDYKMHYYGFEKSQYGIEWMQYDDDCMLRLIMK
jgi:hypothetical protein